LPHRSLRPFACLCGSIGTVRAEPETVISAGPGFNPEIRQNKLFQDYWHACFEINFSDRQEGLTVSYNLWPLCGYGVVMVAKCARLS